MQQIRNEWKTLSPLADSTYCSSLPRIRDFGVAQLQSNDALCNNELSNDALCNNELLAANNAMTFPDGEGGFEVGFISMPTMLFLLLLC